MRHEEARKFASGETKVVVATDAIGMGMNLPVHRIVFLKTEKFDGYESRSLLPQEVQQIAGRAGRYGKHEEGYYASLENPGYILSLYEKDAISGKPIMDIPSVFFEKEGKISEILEAWDSIPTDGVYDKPDLLTKKTLAKELETETTNKDLVLSFISIPFDEKSPALHDLWKELFLSDLYGTPPDFTAFYESNDPSGFSATPESSEKLEELYKKYDLLYNYCHRHRRIDDLKIIMGIKRDISVRGKMILLPFGKEFFQSTVSRFFSPR